MNDSFLKLIGSNRPILAEGAIVERLRRGGELELDPQLAHALFVYDPRGRAALGGLYDEYIQIAVEHGLSLLNFTATWRANPERLRAAGLGGRDVNGDCVRFLREVQAKRRGGGVPLFVGGLMGCRGDAYRPGEALSEQDAAAFHRPQAEALARAGVDFLFGATLPAVCEARGMARAMAAQGVPYALSFVLGPGGRVLDGATLAEAIRRIDASAGAPPLFYMVNCCHPTFLEAAFAAGPGDDEILAERLAGIQANASSLSPEELDNSPELMADAPEELAAGMLRLFHGRGVRVLGGCCGTDGRLLRILARKMSHRAGQPAAR